MGLESNHWPNYLTFPLAWSMASFVNSPPELRFFTRENINLLTRRRMIVPERGGEREADRCHTWWMGFCASSKAQQDTRIRPSFFKPPTICIYRNVFWGTLNITQMPANSHIGWICNWIWWWWWTGARGNKMYLFSQYMQQQQQLRRIQFSIVLIKSNDDNAIPNLFIWSSKRRNE